MDSKYKLDLKETLLRNLLWIPMFIFIVIFAFMGLSSIHSFESDETRLMFLIFDLFFTFKLLSWLGHPDIIFKEQKGEGER